MIIFSTYMMCNKYHQVPILVFTSQVVLMLFSPAYAACGSSIGLMVWCSTSLWTPESLTVWCWFQGMLLHFHHVSCWNQINKSMQIYVSVFCPFRKWPAHEFPTERHAVVCLVEKAEKFDEDPVCTKKVISSCEASPTCGRKPEQPHDSKISGWWFGLFFHIWK